jgi:hypothetical protein
VAHASAAQERVTKPAERVLPFSPVRGLGCPFLPAADDPMLARHGKRSRGRSMAGSRRTILASNARPAKAEGPPIDAAPRAGAGRS